MFVDAGPKPLEVDSDDFLRYRCTRLEKADRKRSRHIGWLKLGNWPTPFERLRNGADMLSL